MAKLKFGVWIPTYAWADDPGTPESVRENVAKIKDSIVKCEEHAVETRRATGARRPAPRPAARRGHGVRVIRGVWGAIRGHPYLYLGVGVAVVAMSVLGPVLVLSLARRPVDYFTFNPWLKRLPAYVVSSTIPFEQKLEKLPALALFWFSSDSPYGGTDWGFAVDVTDAARILLLAALFGAYFALLAHGRADRAAPATGALATRRSGVAGMLASVVGLSTGPCSVMRARTGLRAERTGRSQR